MNKSVAIDKPTREPADSKGTFRKLRVRLTRERIRAALRRRYLRLGVLPDWTMSRLGLAQPVVLVSGFWRSGTTWLLECLAESLNAKTINEPLSTNSPLRRRMLQRAGIEDTDMYDALVHRRAAADDGVWKYLDRAFSGKSADQFYLYCRKSLGESLRRLIVVKEVRLQLNLQEAHDRYRLPVVHIRRHPGAVISSLLATQWGRMFEDIRLAEVLPDFAAELAEFDTDLISKMSAYWAVTERFVDVTTQGQPWARIISYEQAVSDPGTTISELCTFIGQEQRKVPNFRESSYSTSIKMKVPNFEARPRAWRDNLPEADIERMRFIVAKLYPQFVFD